MLCALQDQTFASLSYPYAYLFFSSSAFLLPIFYYSIPTCNFWSAPIHALIIYSKENHRQRYNKGNTVVHYSRTEVGQEMKTFHVVLDRNKHAHDKITLLSLLQILFQPYLELYYDGLNNHSQATQFIFLRSFCMDVLEKKDPSAWDSSVCTTEIKVTTCF